MSWSCTTDDNRPLLNNKDANLHHQGNKKWTESGEKENDKVSDLVMLLKNWWQEHALEVFV